MEMMIFTKNNQGHDEGQPFILVHGVTNQYVLMLQIQKLSDSRALRNRSNSRVVLKHKVKASFSVTMLQTVLGYAAESYIMGQ